MGTIDDFMAIRPKYEQFTLKVQDLLTTLINDKGIDLISIEGRTKSIESFKEKINRPGKKYNNPIEDITDLCGIRVITYYTEDIYKIAEIIENEFKVDFENSIDKTKISIPDKFGYQSMHYIFSIGRKRDRLTEWKSFGKFKVEIQIRTILQHSWAAIDHKLRYKSKGEIPSELKRKIYRLSALLELADEQFLSIKLETEQLSSKIDDSIDKGILNLEFNFLSISSYLVDNGKVVKLVEAAEKNGFLPEVPIEDSDLNYFYSRLISILKFSRFKSIKDLDEYIDSIIPKAPKLFKAYVEKFNSFMEGENIYAVPSDVIAVALLSDPNSGVDPSDPDIYNVVNWVPLIHAAKLLRE